MKKRRKINKTLLTKVQLGLLLNINILAIDAFLMSANKLCNNFSIKFRCHHLKCIVTIVLSPVSVVVLSPNKVPILSLENVEDT